MALSANGHDIKRAAAHTLLVDVMKGSGLELYAGQITALSG
jgi:hypothetical protein